MTDVQPSNSQHLSDEALLDLVQRCTLDYFWDFAHPVSGMARERSNSVAGYNYLDTVCSGGTGFGVMALISGAERGFLSRADVLVHIEKIVAFLERAERYHGVFSHFLHGGSGKTIPFSAMDDGGDLVETSYLMVGLLCARQYFSAADTNETKLRAAIDALWHAVEWDWHARDRKVLYWHWSPRHGWAMNQAITGWNECLVTYVLAAASPTHGISPSLYHDGWTASSTFRNGKSYYGITLPLGPPYGGPLLFSHYSFLGLDPRSLRDRYADYWQQCRAHALINRAYCIANPKHFEGYGEAWGLSACDSDVGYSAFCPENDCGVIAPTAALSSMPYTHHESMMLLRHLYVNVGRALWGRYGFIDSFNASSHWRADGNLAVDQGPIVVMIENYRSGLLWDLVMSCDEVRAGLNRLAFESPNMRS